MSSSAINMKLCQGKDVLERMNYLYQASRLMALQLNNPVAASYYGNIMVGCAKKAVLRMDSAIKRTVCKSCQSPLIPGETARVRLVSKPTKMLKWTCLTCGATRKFPVKKGYKLWSEQPEALVEFFDYTPKKKKKNSLEQPDGTNECIDSSKLNFTSLDCEASSSIKNHNDHSSITEKSMDFIIEDITDQEKDVKSKCTMAQD